MRTVWRSRDGGRTWEPCVPRPGSIIASMAMPTEPPFWTDGFGNWYRGNDPNEEVKE